MINALIVIFPFLFGLTINSHRHWHQPIGIDVHKAKQIVVRPDSSDYRLNVLKTDYKGADVNFLVFDKNLDSLSVTISVTGNEEKVIYAVVTNGRGKLLLRNLVDIKSITVSKPGYGKVVIPFRQLENKLSDVRVRLYSIEE